MGNPSVYNESERMWLYMRLRELRNAMAVLHPRARLASCGYVADMV